MLGLNEISLLKAIGKDYKSLEDIASTSNFNEDFVRRSLEVFKQEGLIDTKTEEKKGYILGEFGKIYVNEEFPEEIIAKSLASPKSMQDLQQELGSKANLYIGLAKKSNIISIENNLIHLNKEFDIGKYSNYRKQLNKIKNQEEADVSELVKMPKMLTEDVQKKIYAKITSKGEEVREKEFVNETNQLTQSMLKERTFDKQKFRKYNVEANVKESFGGKYQPYKRFLELIRKKLTSMGFEEMPTSLTTTEFYNFDVLYQPQNHAARTWTDTYTLKTPSVGQVKDVETIQKVKDAHENGGVSGSRGWGYKWDPSIALRMMPAAHGTAFSAKKMSEGINVPGRYFAVSRVYRPDVLDATHLNEFNQLEGFVVANDLSFKHLLGMLRKFALEIAGAKDIMFYPDYYPFTEPSVQLSAKHPKLGWVEFGGAGIFRPEITQTLGINQRVMAWGLGIDRLAMFNLGINDIRDLFSNKLDWLREKEIVEKI